MVVRKTVHAPLPCDLCPCLLPVAVLLPLLRGDEAAKGFGRQEGECQLCYTSSMSFVLTLNEVSEVEKQNTRGETCEVSKKYAFARGSPPPWPWLTLYLSFFFLSK